MLLRSKEVEEKKNCLCLEGDEKCAMVECTMKNCSSPWWHMDCAGLSGLTNKEVKKMSFVCPLCLLSGKKFSNNFLLVNAQQKEMEKIVDRMEKNEVEMKEMQKVMMGEIQKLKDLKEGCTDKEEKQREVFYQKVSNEIEIL